MLRQAIHGNQYGIEIIIIITNVYDFKQFLLK